ncbi:MAG: DUF983 domain-containing protein [Rhizobiaceae bacterium]|nr:DUF983 domain-containing protein [Rhizobiaceae bacterium]
MADQGVSAGQVYGSESGTGRPQRSLMDAVKRGIRGRCPHCGEGKLFRAYTKTVDQCDACGEEIFHHRADDLPAYLVITVVGHIVLTLFLAAEIWFSWTSWQHLSVWVPITLLMSLAMLQPAKGAVVGIQWANYMHGFGGNHEELDTHPELSDSVVK